MSAEFRAQLGAVIHGRYSLDGSSYIYIDPDHSAHRREGIEVHEWVHSELLDTTAFGRFQQMLNLVTEVAPPGDFRDRCADLLNYSMDVCSVAHEGLAAYREFCWLVSNEGYDSASSYLDALPAHYRHGVDQVTKLLGNPLESPYQGLTPPAFHTWLTALGLAVMNSPILAEYSNPDRIFQEPLTWLLIDGPDQRLEKLEESAKIVATSLSSLRREPSLNVAVNEFARTGKGFLLDDFLNHGIETLRGTVPQLAMLTKVEASDQLARFNAHWIKRLNELAGTKFVAGGPTVDVANERSLNMRIYPSNYEQHEAALAQENALSVDFAGLVDAAQSLESPNVVYQAILNSQDPDLTPENIVKSSVDLLGVPLWAASEVEDSPWVSFQQSYMIETTFDDFLSMSEKLARAGWCWYTNQMIVVFLRQIERLPHGFIFERCGSAKNVLNVLDHALRSGTEAHGYYIRNFDNNETLVGVVYENVLSFSIATDIGATSFEEAVAIKGLARLEEHSIQIGGRHVSLGLAARWARWGALGS